MSYISCVTAHHSIRKSTVALFKRLEAFDSTRPAVRCMNDFLKLALNRQAQDVDTTVLNAPISSAEGGASGDL